MRAVPRRVKQTTRCGDQALSSTGVVLPRVRRRLLSSVVGVDMTTDSDDVIRCPNMSSGRVGWSKSTSRCCRKRVWVGARETWNLISSRPETPTHQIPSQSATSCSSDPPTPRNAKQNQAKIQTPAAIYIPLMALLFPNIALSRPCSAPTFTVCLVVSVRLFIFIFRLR